MDISPRRLLNYIEWHRTSWVRLNAEEERLLLGLFARLAPQQAVGMTKTRIGAGRDGGYVMLDDFREIDLALSLGIGPDVSWDMALAERKIPVWQFDHTVSAPPRSHALFHFQPRKITAHDAGAETITLAALLQEAGERRTVLKMDVDGDEWDILGGTDFQLLHACRQIVLELHDFSRVADASWRHRTEQALARLTAHFQVVHVHGNNLSKHLLGKSGCFPDSLEVSLAHRGFYQFEPTLENFPGRHDRKNNPYFPDFGLGRFQFPASPG